MAEQDMTPVWLIGGALAVGGLVWALSQGQGQGQAPRKGITALTSNCELQGEQLSNPASLTLEQSGPGYFRIPIGQTLELKGNTILYQGPGRDVFTAARIIQQMGDQWVTVYGSGIAGIHLYASPVMKEFALVPSDPPSALGGSLVLYPWPPGPSPTSNPICGQAAVPGLDAILLLEVFGICSSADADGYSSVTCMKRQPLRRHEYDGKVAFVIPGS